MKVAVFVDPKKVSAEFVAKIGLRLKVFLSDKSKVTWVCIGTDAQREELDSKGIAVRLAWLMTRKPESGRASGKIAADFLTKNNFDLGIAFRHSQAGVTRFFLGSFSETLVQLSPVSILVIPPNYLKEKISNKALYALDLGKGSEKRLHTFLKWVSRWQFHPLASFVAEPWFFNKELEASSFANKKQIILSLKTLEQHMLNTNPKAQLFIEKGLASVSTLVLKRAKKEKVGLLVTHSVESGVKRWLLSSVSSQLLRQSPIAILVLKK